MHNRDAYVAYLEQDNTALRAEVARLQKEINKWVSLTLEGEKVREANMVKAILAGAFSGGKTE